MSLMKRFIEDVSERMGAEGEITNAVLIEARRILLVGTQQKCELCGRFRGLHNPGCSEEAECHENSPKNSSS